MQPNQPPTMSDAVTPTSPTRRILLVENNVSLAHVYVSRLQAEGFEVRRIHDAHEALPVALSYHPDLVLLDIMTPQVNGFDVLDVLRSNPSTAHLKVIMLTAIGQESDKERAKILNVDDYLVKSEAVIADVIDRIKYHLDDK